MCMSRLYLQFQEQPLHFSYRYITSLCGTALPHTLMLSVLKHERSKYFDTKLYRLQTIKLWVLSAHSLHIY